MTTEPAAEPFPSVPQWEAAPMLLFGVPGVPYSSIRIPLVTEPVEAAAWVDLALKMAAYLSRKYAEAFPEAVEAPRAQNRQQSAPRSGGRPQQQQEGEGRAARFPLIEGWACDVCGGPCGVRAKTGRMRSDAVVCLGRCKDGEYVHGVGFLE